MESQFGGHVGYANEEQLLALIERFALESHEMAVTDAPRRPLAKAMLAVFCVSLCAACRDEPPDPGATDRAAAVDLFSAWPGDASFRIAAEPSLVVGSDESLPLGRVSGAVFFGDGIALADVQAYEVLSWMLRDACCIGKAGKERVPASMCT